MPLKFSTTAFTSAPVEDSALPAQAGQVNQRPGFRGTKPEDLISRDPFDVTVGAFEYGAADTARSIASRIGRATGSDYANDVASSLRQFQEDHPNYAPVQVQNAWDLITNPKALVSHFSAGAPFMLAVGGLSAIPYAGVPLSMGLAYGVESQNAYESAIADGADEGTASTIGNITGVLNAGLQVASLNRIFKIPHLTVGGAGKSIVQEALAKTLTTSKALGLAGPAIKNLAIVALETSLQGAVREAVPSQIEGKPIPSGFIERRLSELVDGAVAAEVFGIGRYAKDVAFGKVSATTPEGDGAVGQLDMFSRKDFENILIDKFQLNENRVQDILHSADAFAKTWAARNGKSPDEFWANAFAFDNGEDVGEILNQGDSKVRNASLNNVKGFFSGLRKTIAEKLGNKQEVSLYELDRFVRNPKNQVKLEEVVWTGLGDMISSVDEARRAETKVPMQQVLQMLDKNEIQLATYTKSESEKARVKAAYNDNQEAELKLHEQFGEDLKKAKTPQEKAQLADQFAQAQAELSKKSQELRQDIYNRQPTYLESQTPGDARNFRNLLVRFPFTEGDKPGGKPREAYKDEHWPEIPNVILDLHLDERSVEIPGGKEEYLKTGQGSIYEQTTHAGDIQSKLHQQGREEGYRERGEKPKGQYSVVKVSDIAGGREEYEIRDPSGAALTHSRFVNPEEAQDIADRFNGRATENKVKGADQRAPDAPFKRTQSWVKLAAKFMFNEALENGSHRISWDTEEQRLAAWPGLGKEARDMYRETVPKEFLNYAKSLDPEAKIEVVKVGETQQHSYAGPDRSSEEIDAIPVGTEDKVHAFHASMQGMLRSGLSMSEAFEATSLIFDQNTADRAAKSFGGRLVSENQEIFAPSIKITEKMRAKIQEEGQPLFQSNKASVRFLNDGRAVIKALENPDASSALEELFHVAERKLIAGDDRALAEQALGVKDGIWEPEDRERLVQNFLQYARIGRAPNSKLQGLFSNIKNWMKEIYPNLAKDARVGGGKFRVSDELRGIFDRMYLEDSDPVKAKRLEIRALNDRLEELRAKREPEDPISPEPENPTDLAERARAEVLSGTRPGDVGRELEVGQPIDLDNAGTSQAERAGGESEGATAGNASDAAEAGRIKGELKQRRRELWDLQNSLFIPGDPSPAARRAEEINSLPAVLGTENLEEGFFRKSLHAITRPLQRLVGMEAGIREFPAGQEFLARAGNVESYVNLKHGLFNEKLKDAYLGLSKADIKWAMSYTFDENGNAWPNIVKLLDPAGSPEQVVAPTEAIKRLQDLHTQINDEATKEQIKWGLLRKLKNDDVVTAKRSKLERMPRQITEEAWHAMLQGSGRLYNRIIDAFHTANLEINPSLKRKDVADEIQRFYGKGATRRLGQLEFSRLLKRAPAVIQFDGKAFTVYHHEPHNVLSTSIQRQFGRIGFVKEFGQGVLKDVGRLQMKKVLGVFGIEVQKETKQHVLERLDEAGVLSPELSGLPQQALKRLAKQLDIPIGESRETMMAKILELSPNSLYENLQIGQENKALARRQLKGLRRVAKELKAVDPSMEPADLLNAVKQRVQEHVEDRLYTKLRDAYGKQGGNLDYFDAGMQLLQGMPFKPLPKNFYTLSMRLVSNVVGALQTSTSAAPNLVQTASLVPAFAGAKNFFEATREYLANPEKSISTIAGLGALKYDVLARTSEPGYTLQSWGKYIQQGLGKVTQLSKLDLQNNAIAGEAFRRLGESWRESGIGKADLGTAKFLRLSDAEVQRVNKGGMDQELLAKIVQNGVAGTQFRTEGNWRKGLTENAPLAKILFAYSSYTNGVARTVGSLMREAKGLNKTDPYAVAGFTRKLLFAVAGTAGAGMASIVIRQALKGQLNQQVETIDDTALEKAGAGLWEAGVFGATQRLMEPFSRDRGVFERGMIGLMPQVTAVSRLVQAIIGGYGKWGRFDPATRIWEAGKDNTPLARGMSNWLEQKAWPEYSEYKAAMGEMRRFKKENQPESGSGGADAQLNPDYYPVALAVMRGDQQEAIEQAQRFYSKIPRIIADAPAGTASVQTVMRNFRASLVQRAPLNLRDENQMVYLSKLPEERRRKVFLAHQKYMMLLDAVAPRGVQD